MLGTPAYMAPEQVFGERDVDRRADIWALGLIVYQCLSGVLPTEGENVGQVLKNVLAKPFEPLDRLVPDLPREVSTLVGRMLARERSERPADLREVLAVLGRFASAGGAALDLLTEHLETRVPTEHLETRVPTEHLETRAPTEHLETRVPTEHLETRVPTEHLETRAPTEHLETQAPTEHLETQGARANGPSVAPREGGAAVVTVAPPAPSSPGQGPPRWARLRGALGGAVALALIGAGVAGLRRTRSSALASPTPAAASPPAATSPLDPPSAKLACPVLAASGVREPSGWLGAAAAATACERARLILGGRADRTLVPAELLDLPPGPVDAFPADPYGRPDAREASRAAARGRAAAYLDGEVDKAASGFRVVLSLRRADGTEIAGSQGEGPALFEAVRAAMSPLVGPGKIPKASALDPVVAAWSRTSDVDAGLALADLNLALYHNAGGLTDECARFEQRSAEVGEMGPAERWRCAYTLGSPETPVDVFSTEPAADAATFATRARINHFIYHADRPADADRLHELYNRDKTSLGRSLLATTESCLIQSSDPKRAYEMALLAVLAEPKNPDGQVCDPWGQLMTMAQGTASEESAMRALQAWQPWNGTGWWMQGRGAKDPGAALAPLRRAYALTPFDTQVVDIFADKLLAAGNRDEARAVALATRSGGHPVHLVESELILLRVEASESNFASALAQARKAFETPGDGAGWVRAQRFEVAWRALELAGILGRAAEVADLLVQRFLDPEPPPLDGSALAVPMRLPAVCALASPTVADRCFARFRALRGRLSGGITRATDDFMAGAERYVKGDFRGATRAWRPLLRGSAELASVMPDAMAEAFERVGDVALAEQVDAAAMARASEFNGATLAHARKARRAFALGDTATARSLAEKVVEAWSKADEAVPAVGERGRLLKRLPPKP
ncbi:serine/threonine protein kinase [Sorangium sp. So ce1000]|uniref:serine/threonine protein kinase n=1 Tax=Sorangium sp. So ce1000 TaxID=3133325 RepID=UPI003F633793